MATTADLLAEAFGRIRETGHQVVDGLGPDQLRHRVDSQANSIAWLVWHAARIQDDHAADVADTEQVWTSGGWVERFGLPFDGADTGYGHSGDDVAAVQAPAKLLTGYLDAVVDRSLEYLMKLSDDDLDRVVDENWDPPVTLAVRLVSVLDDDIQHLGQAAFVRGLVDRA